MSPVLRVCWTFYTAFPLQRWLAVAGVLTGGLALAGGMSSGDAAFYVLGGIFFTVLAVFPAVFASGAILRALSAPRNHQLWPHFRVRMLVAVAVFVTTLVLLPPALIVLPALATDRAIPAAALVYPFGLVTTVYLWAFLFSGDGRFALLGPALLFAVLFTLRGSLGPADAMAASVLPLVAVASLLAWVVFVVWYLRVRRVGPWMLTANRTGGWEVPSNRPLTRETALQALLTGRMKAPFVRQTLATVALVGALSALPLLSRGPNLHLLATTPLWAFFAMALAGARTVPITHQSRLLWLRVDGLRDGVRQEIERVAWRRWLTTFAAIAVLAFLAPAVRGGSVQDLALGLAACASAAVYGGYVVLAAPTDVKTQLAALGLMTVAHIALVVRAEASVTSAALAVAAQLAGAVLFRALAVRRWRRIDWLRLQPWAALRGSHRFTGV